MDRTGLTGIVRHTFPSSVSEQNEHVLSGLAIRIRVGTQCIYILAVCRGVCCAALVESGFVYLL